MVLDRAVLSLRCYNYFTSKVTYSSSQSETHTQLSSFYFHSFLWLGSPQHEFPRRGTEIEYIFIFEGTLRHNSHYVVFFIFETQTQLERERERDTTFLNSSLYKNLKTHSGCCTRLYAIFVSLSFFNAPFFLTHIHRHTNTYNIEIELDYPTVFHEKLLTNDQINAIVYKICF